MFRLKKREDVPPFNTFANQADKQNAPSWEIFARSKLGRAVLVSGPDLAKRLLGMGRRKGDENRRNPESN